MLTLEIGNKKLITGGSFSCRINAKNPFCQFDGIPGPLAADISLPAEDNAGLLNHPNRVTKRGAQNDRHFAGSVLRHNGAPLIAGNFVVTRALNTVEGWVQNHIGELAEQLREKTLSELTILGDQNFANKATFDPDTDLWCTIRLMNRGFWKDKGKMSDSDSQVEELTEKFEAAAGFMVNQNASGGVITAAGTDGVAVVSPFPFLHSLIDAILRQNQFYVSDNFLKTDADLKTLCLYHNHNILVDTPTTESTILDFIEFFFNNYEELDLEKISSSTWGLGSFRISDLLPGITLKDFMLSIQNTWNVFFWTNSNRTVQIIDRESIFTGNAFPLEKYRVTPWEPGERKDVTLKFTWEHDGSDSAFNDEYEDLDNKRANIQASVVSKADLLGVLIPKVNGHIRLVEAENRYYEYGWHTFTKEVNGEETSVDALGWKPVSIGLQNYFFNDGDKDVEEIASKFSTLRMGDSGYPVVYQNGNSKTFSSVDEDFSPRLMFYKGNNTGGDESISGKKIDWKGDAGIIFNRWRLTAPFWANRLPIEATFRFPTNILKYVLDHIYQRFSDSECDFIIEELDAEPGAADETIVEISGYKIEDNYWASNPGSVPGGGDGTIVSFDSKFIGVNKYGKPYLIDASGKYKTTSVFGAISASPYAHASCVDYNPATHQLFIGGDSGYIHIYDLTANFRMKTIRVIYSTDSVSCVKVCGNSLMVGRNNSANIYVVALHAGIDDYADASATAVALPGGYTARDFALVDGYYFCCTKAGEVFRSASPTSGWNELFDIDGEFTRLAVTDTRIYVFETGDRPFYALRSSPTNFIEYRLTGSDEPCIVEAAAGAEQVVALTSQYTNNVFIIDNPETQLRKSIGAFPKGVVYDGADIYISGELSPTLSGALYKYVDGYFASQFSLPEGMKLLLY